jgi:molybdopterin-biosynthesis enzyme MoeA-like protein
MFCGKRLAKRSIYPSVTLKGIAAALNCEMEFNEEMAQLLREKMNQSDETNGAELTEAQRKMAFLPTCSKLRYLSRNPKDWPVLQCKNIFVLPGVPEFFAQKIENVAAYLSCQLERTTALKVVLKVDENSIVPILNEVVENHPNVSIGSYPFVSHPDFKTVITVEGRWISGGRSNSTIIRASMVDLNQKSASDCNVQMALNDLINRLPEGSVLRVDNDDMMMS